MMKRIYRIYCEDDLIRTIYGAIINMQQEGKIILCMEFINSEARRKLKSPNCIGVQFGPTSQCLYNVTIILIPYCYHSLQG